jgi:hypothetical protein
LGLQEMLTRKSERYSFCAPASIPAQARDVCKFARRRFRGVVYMALLTGSIFLLGHVHPAFPSRPPVSNGHPDIQALVRDTAWNELQARRHPAHYYERLLKETTPDSSRTHLQIQTPQGSVSRLIEVDGKPPTEKQCRNNFALLDRIAASSVLQETRLTSQRSEMRRREQLFTDMPAAFLFQYEGTEGKTGWIRIRYRPNPDFHIRNRVAGVLVGLQGTMWIDPSSKRIARIQGSLNKDVTFGWGILARLYRGGRFMLEQSRLPDGNWQETLLFVEFKGSILLFKKLDVNVTQTISSYKDMANNLTIEQAVGILEHVSVHCTAP